MSKRSMEMCENGPTSRPRLLPPPLACRRYDADGCGQIFLAGGAATSAPPPAPAVLEPGESGRAAEVSAAKAASPLAPRPTTPHATPPVLLYLRQPRTLPQRVNLLSLEQHASRILGPAPQLHCMARGTECTSMFSLLDRPRLSNLLCASLSPSRQIKCIPSQRRSFGRHRPEVNACSASIYHELAIKRRALLCSRMYPCGFAALSLTLYVPSGDLGVVPGVSVWSLPFQSVLASTVAKAILRQASIPMLRSSSVLFISSFDVECSTHPGSTSSSEPFIYIYI